MPDELALTMTTPSADLLNRPVPALSATSDMPVIEPEPAGDPPPVAEAPAEGDEAPALEAETPAEGDEATAAEPPPPRQDPRTVRIRTLEQQLADRDARDRERDARMDRLLAVIEQRATPEPPPPPAAPEPAPKPRRESFDNPDAYDDALLEWGASEAERRLEAKLTQRATEAAAADQGREVETQQTKAAETWGQRRAAFVEAHPDYETVAESDAVTISIPMAQVISQHEHGPAIAYWLGQNPQEAQRIADMTQLVTPRSPADERANMGKLIAAATELGRASASAVAPPSPPPPPVSRAPAPIRPITGASASAAERSAEEMTGDEYFDANIARHQAGRRASSVGRTVN